MPQFALPARPVRGGASQPSGRTLLTIAAAASFVVAGVLLWQNTNRVITLALLVAAVSLGGIVREWARGRLISADLFVYVFVFSTFSLSAITLWNQRSQLERFRWAKTQTELLTNLRSQEIALFVTSRFSADYEATLFKTVGLGAVFLVAFIAGRVFVNAPRARRRPRVFLNAPPDPLLLKRVVIAFILIGLVAQVIIIVGAGGLGGALANLESQDTLRQSFKFFVLRHFGIVGIFLWAAYGPLRGRSLALFLAVLAETVLFGFLTGSRSSAVVPVLGTMIIIHLARRRFRRRELAAAFLAAVVVLTGFVALRQVSASQPLGQAVRAGISNSVSLDVLSNDNSSFNDVFIMAALVPESIPYQRGARLAAGATTIVPSVLLPGKKPEAGDVWWRKTVWGNTHRAGRPYTIVGEFWIDFGWSGLWILAFLFGALCGRMAWTGRPLPDGVDRGRAIIAAMFVLTVFATNDGTYGNTISFMLQYAVPLAIAFVLMRHLGRRTATA